MTVWRRGVAERLRWLLDVTRAPRRAVAGQRYGEAGLAAYLAERLGEDLNSMHAEVARACAGETVRVEVLDEIAKFFDIPAAFFGADIARVASIQDTVLVRALAAAGIRSWLICRMALTRGERRRQLRAVLAAFQPMSDDNRWHDGRQSVEGSWHGGSGEPMDVALDADELRRVCNDLVHELDLVAPFDADELCTRLATRRGRKIVVRAADLGGTTGVGHLVQTRFEDRILVDAAAPNPQRDLVIYHEVVHLVRGHLDNVGTMSCGLGDARQPGDPAADWCEREAELGARELATLAQQPPRPNRLSATASDTDRSIAAAFGFTDRS